ncbi:MAG: hypothetical protein J7K36_00375, partial [Archaeoglobaceae archaeon]|nr:hypothetical protein [Archaeoglobaceae archaeon]
VLVALLNREKTGEGMELDISLFDCSVPLMLNLMNMVLIEGMTILLVEQNVFASLEISDYVYVLNEGRVAVEGTVDEIKESEEVKRAYVGV